MLLAWPDGSIQSAKKISNKASLKASMKLSWYLSREKMITENTPTKQKLQNNFRT